jgi:cyclophilin family peptidyl-prolyl cis-trans isomerase
MANRGADTNGGQFFIVYDDTPLPPSYTVFGSVADVQAVVELAGKGTETLESGVTAPTEDVDIQQLVWE